MAKRLIAWALALLLGMASLPVLGQSGDQEEQSPDPVKQIMEGMTLEEKVAQMFLVRCPSSGALKTVKDYQPGGYILFAADFEGEMPGKSPSECGNYINLSWQQASKVPMLVGVDEEGGTVTRVSRFKAFRSEKFWSPRDLYAQGGIPLIMEDALEKSQLLLDLGVNFNLAPVADIATQRSDFMYQRSLGQDAQTTALYVASVVGAMNQAGIASALKHFPGYGDNKDTHAGLVVDKRPYETFLQQDFLPFQAGIQAGAGCILVAHNIVNCMDGERPASLSPRVHQILREELGFAGVIMTDDLSMGAIKEYTGSAAAAVLAVEAGNDLLCCSNFSTQYRAVLDAVQEGRMSEERVEQSVERILRWKLELGIIAGQER